MQRLLEICARYPARLIERLRRLTPAEIDAALGNEPSHADIPLLTDGEVALILSRRDALIAHVDGLIETHGAARVLAFP